MQFAFISLLSVVAATFAAPGAIAASPAPTKTVANPSATKTPAVAPFPDSGLIYPLVVCTEPNFTGTCAGLGIEGYGPSNCYNLPTVLNDTISSANELYTNVQCHLWLDPNCGGADFFVDYPNSPIANIDTSPFAVGAISSYYCNAFAA